ncbi:YtxH domain-containing protein [Staphylococcus epidermidis]|uniref:YtxH domain-containing protein n=1 Tax=Staphylococcus epidermidis TaxID=1282 RepID=UPI0010049CE9|nr:YtxH domain-containing protein [Staphylococcus epidermidis]RTE18441.1 hypothetical protein BKL67_11595 [Staphylococcus epidermidis]
MKDDIVPSVMNGMNANMSKVNEIKGNTESTIKDYQVKTNQTIKKTKKTINQVSDTVKGTSHHFKEHVGPHLRAHETTANIVCRLMHAIKKDIRN